MHSLSDAPRQPRVPGGCPRTSRACILVYILYFTAETHHLQICSHHRLATASVDQRSREASGTPAWTRIYLERPAEPQRAPGDYVAAAPSVGVCGSPGGSVGRGAADAVRHGRTRHRNLGSGACGRVIVAPLGGAPDGLAPITTRGPGPQAVDVGRIPHPVGRPTPRVAWRSGRRRHRPGGGGAAHPVETCCARH